LSFYLFLRFNYIMFQVNTSIPNLTLRLVFTNFNSSTKKVGVKDPFFNTTSIPESAAKTEPDTWFYLEPGEKFDPFKDPPYSI